MWLTCMVSSKPQYYDMICELYETDLLAHSNSILAIQYQHPPIVHYYWSSYAFYVEVVIDDYGSERGSHAARGSTSLSAILWGEFTGIHFISLHVSLI